MSNRTRVHKTVKQMWRTMQRLYRRGMDARLAVRVPWPERVHNAGKKPETDLSRPEAL